MVSLQPEPESGKEGGVEAFGLGDVVNADGDVGDHFG